MGLLHNETAGDPLNGLRWCRRSTANLSRALHQDGFAASPRTVARLLRDLQFSLRVNRKLLAPKTHPRRDEQFRHIADLRAQIPATNPIVSVDAKQKELVGLFRNPGSSWQQDAVAVFDHDYPSWASDKLTPYGIYDLRSNTGWVGLGLSADTPAFAVDCLTAWWTAEGSLRYPHATALVVLADSGGSNGCHPRAWKYYLQHNLCNPYGLSVRVAHYPSGCSKFNPIEHRLFSEISKNWAGVPLQSVETILNYILTTTTETGLSVHAELIPNEYQEGMQISDAEMAALSLTTHDPLPKLNYTISPTTTKKM